MNSENSPTLKALPASTRAAGWPGSARVSARPSPSAWPPDNPTPPASRALVADQAVTWVAERIWWIGGTLAACFILATVASMWLEAWAGRRGARFAERHGIRSRADVILPGSVRAVVTGPAFPAIAPAPQVTINVFGRPDAGQAEVIRRALGAPD